MKTYDPILAARFIRDEYARFWENSVTKDHLDPRAPYLGLSVDTYQKVVTDLYEAATEVDDSTEVTRLAYKQFARELFDQFATMVDRGVVVEFVDDDPTNYTEDGKLDPGAFFADYRKTGVLKIYRSDDSDHPLLGQEKIQYRGRLENANSIFRAVHDFLGHMAEGVGFAWGGETRAYYSHASTFSNLAVRALFTEAVGQQSYYYQRGDYVPVQKAFLYPVEFHNAPLNNSHREG